MATTARYVMNRLVLIPAISLAVALLATQPVAASAANPGQHAESGHPSVIGTIDGGGTANMMDLVRAGFKGVTKFEVHATLFSDGSARGDVTCIDVVGDAPGYPGKIFGDVTSWSRNANGHVALHIPHANVVPIPGGPQFPPSVIRVTMTIQRFGGEGVGHWTMASPGITSPFNGGPICQELMTSGQIRWHDMDEEREVSSFRNG